jgi:hypothetical protein
MARLPPFSPCPFAPQTADASWTTLELFAVHPEVGVASVAACGALITARGMPVTQVTRDFLRFANGLVARKALLNVTGSVAVWDWKAPTQKDGQ